MKRGPQGLLSMKLTCLVHSRTLPSAVLSRPGVVAKHTAGSYDSPSGVYSREEVRIRTVSRCTT